MNYKETASSVFALSVLIPPIELVQLMTLLLLVCRSPAAMKAASEEVRRTFENSYQQVDPMNSRLVLTREQLDNMPILGGKIFKHSCTQYYYHTKMTC